MGRRYTEWTVFFILYCWHWHHPNKWLVVHWLVNVGSWLLIETIPSIPLHSQNFQYSEPPAATNLDHPWSISYYSAIPNGWIITHLRLQSASIHTCASFQKILLTWCGCTNMDFHRNSHASIASQMHPVVFFVARCIHGDEGEDIAEMIYDDSYLLSYHLHII